MDHNFEKRYTFTRQNDWILPEVTEFFTGDIWKVEALNEFKTELNEVKSLLNDKGQEWHDFTFRINKAAFVSKAIKETIRPDLLTQAWCKFFEILCYFNLVPKDFEHYKTLHVCEAPGAFISALNCFLNYNHSVDNWEWLANTLNPYYEGHNIKSLVVDDRLLLPTIRNWYFGEDNTGDLTDPSYMKGLNAFVENKGLFDLITADGSFNCLDNPAEQELVVSDLHFAELLVGLHNLSPGAHFVIKKFTMFECITICQMYLLNCIFDEVHVFKPFTSREGNSEVYVICKGYCGKDIVKSHLELLLQTSQTKTKAMFPLSSIPESFILQLIACCEYFLQLQKNAIHENLRLYESINLISDVELRSMQQMYAKEFLNRCNIFPYYSRFKRLFAVKKLAIPSYQEKEKRNGKALYFQTIGGTYETLSETLNWSDNVSDVATRMLSAFPKKGSLISQKRKNDDFHLTPVPKEIFKIMRSNKYDWLVLGKKIRRVLNSKFVNPMLLHLWNRVAHEPEVQMQKHVPGISSSCCCDALMSFLWEEEESENFHVVSVTVTEEKKKENIFNMLFEKFNSNFLYNIYDEENVKKTIPPKNRIFYINTTNWVDSLHSEILIKAELVHVLKSIIEILRKGDVLLICFSSLLTRFSVGMLFMLLSLFEKFGVLLPDDVQASGTGQLWVLKNFLNPNYVKRLIEYLEVIQNIQLPEDKELLEVVPITSLCGGYFYEMLLPLNTSHLATRLWKFLKVESSSF